jgi:hypothetical protein
MKNIRTNDFLTSNNFTTGRTYILHTKKYALVWKNNHTCKLKVQF